MAEILKGSTKVVASAAGVTMLGEAVELLVELSQLVAELRGSRAMCEELIAAVQALLPQLTRMVDSGKIQVMAALQDYKALLQEMRDFLELHLGKDSLTRLASHWNVKEKIKAFYNDRDRLIERIGLDFQEESANRHTVVTNRIDEIMKREQRIEQQAAAELDELKKFITGSLDQMRGNIAADLSAVMGGEVLTTLSDIRYQLKYNTAQSKQDQLFFKDVLAQAMAATNVQVVPSLSVWYISRADIRFETDPFAVGTTRSLHRGSLSSGAKVAVKVVSAVEDNTVKGDWFKNEVDRWYPLRHPNVLPLYGGCHLTTPRLFVMALAEKGSFRDFLPTHRHLTWKLFLDAALGLSYLHKRSTPLVHANLTCSNLLVMADGTGVVSDFAFAFARADSNLSEKVQAPSLRWKAPECLQLGPEANARVQSDIYSLGMCMYEALTGRAPYEGLSDVEFLQAVRERRELPARAPARILDEEWSLIKAMCAYEIQDRIKLDEAIRLISVLATHEKERWSAQPCQCEQGYCSDCGRQFLQMTVDDEVVAKAETWWLPAMLQATVNYLRHLFLPLVSGVQPLQLHNEAHAPASAG